MNVWALSCHRRHAGACPLGGAKTPVHRRQPPGDADAHTPLLSLLGHLRSILLTARGRSETHLQQVEGRRIVKKNAFNDDKKQRRLSLNYARGSGAWLRGRGSLADAKLGGKAGGAATFIDFHTRRLQVFGIPPSDLFHAGIVRPEDFDIRSAGFF